MRWSAPCARCCRVGWPLPHSEGDARHPLLRLNKGQERRLKAGHPWAFSNEIAMKPEYRQLPPGAPVRLEGDDGWRFGTFAFNPHSLIAARLLDRDPDAVIDATFLRTRIEQAAALRARVTDGPYHRLDHPQKGRIASPRATKAARKCCAIATAWGLSP